MIRAGFLRVFVYVIRVGEAITEVCQVLTQARLITVRLHSGRAMMDVLLFCSQCGIYIVVFLLPVIYLQCSFFYCGYIAV